MSTFDAAAKAALLQKLADMTATVTGLDPVAAPVAWTLGAAEGGTFTVPPNSTVRYGAGSTYVTRVMSGVVACNNATFGDPLVGTKKHCDWHP